jgi:hypothetical protein
LPGDARDRLAAGQTVADGRADSATAEGKSAADHGAGKLDRLVEVLCHWVYLLPF